jgi:hypothetical protein
LAGQQSDLAIDRSFDFLYTLDTKNNVILIYELVARQLSQLRSSGDPNAASDASAGERVGLACFRSRRARPPGDLSGASRPGQRLCVRGRRAPLPRASRRSSGETTTSMPIPMLVTPHISLPPSFSRISSAKMGGAGQAPLRIFAPQPSGRMRGRFHHATPR